MANLGRVKGSMIYTGSYSDTALITALEGDLFYDKDYGKIYKYENGTWNDLIGFVPAIEVKNIEGSTLTVGKATNHTQFLGTVSSPLTITVETPIDEVNDYYETWLKLTIGEGGSVLFATTPQIIGDAPEFAVGETWEISIKNGVVVAGKVETNE